MFAMFECFSSHYGIGKEGYMGFLLCAEPPSEVERAYQMML
jgi:hypothetical protein